MESTTVGFRPKEKKSAKVFLRVNDAHAEAFAEGEITEGAIGIEVQCEITGDRWEGLTKKLIVSDGVNGWPMMIRDGKAIIPHEALREGVVLMLGVDGWDAEGKLRIPTILAGACYVSKSVAGLKPMVPLPPSPDIVSQILAAAERALEIAAEIERRADEHEFDGFSPTIEVIPIPGGYQLKITDATGVRTVDIVGSGYDDTEVRNLISERMTKHILDYDGTHILEDGEELTFAQLYEMLMEKPDFCVLVYNNYAYHPNGVSQNQIVFSSEYPVNGYDRAHRITMLANGTVTATETESEHTSSRVNAITEANEGSTVQYPSVKGVADYVKPIKQGLSQCLKEPDGMAVGKYFRIAAIDESGHAVLEAVDAPSGGVTDVQVDGASVVQDGVANLPIPGYGTTNRYTLLRVGGRSGLRCSDNAGTLTLMQNSQNINQISGRYNINNYNDVGAILPYNFDQAVKHAMCDAGTATGDTFGKPLIWTAEEQAVAQQRIGILSSEEVLFG